MRQNKITDTSADISSGGRADRYWRGKKVDEKSAKNIKSKLPEGIDSGKAIDQYKLLKIYRFKGFEWGNWLSNNDRADRLKAAAISLRDLSIVMRSKNLGFDGILGVAFGARGNSKAAAQ